MASAVYDVHHWYRETVSGYSAKETIQRNFKRSCRCSAACDRYCKDCICSKFGFVLCSVCCNHSCIYCIDIACIKTFNCFVDCCVDVLYCFLHTFSKVTSFISISQFQSFEFSCGSTAWSSSSCNSAIHQIYFCLYCRVSSGIQNFSSNYFLNF